MTSASTEERDTTIVVETRVRDGRSREFAAWWEVVTAALADEPGFVSQELIPADPPGQPHWVSIQRWRSPDAADAWMRSARRRELLAGAADLLVGDEAVSVIDAARPRSGREPDAGPRPSSAVTLVVHSRLRMGAESAFLAWHDRIEAAQATFAGYGGSRLQPPIAGIQDEWVSMLTFDSPGRLDAWLDSAERRALLAEADAEELMASAEDTRRVPSGFEGWLTFTRRGTAAAPPWKINYLVMVGRYPIVMFEVIFLSPTLDWMGVTLSSLVGIVPSVALLGWPIMPALTKAMDWWLRPPPDARPHTDPLGALALVAVLAVGAAAFGALAAQVHIEPVVGP